MIGAMPAVAVRRGRKKSKSFGRFHLPASQRSSQSSLSRQHGSIATVAQSRALRVRRQHQMELDRQRRRFIIYVGTLFLASGLFLVFIGVGAMVPTAQTVGLLLIGVGAVLCIIKVFWSESQATEVPSTRKVTMDEVESNRNEGSTALADISEFTELNTANNGAAQQEGHSNNITPTSPPNSVQETQVLIGNDSGSARY